MFTQLLPCRARVLTSVRHRRFIWRFATCVLLTIMPPGYALASDMTIAFDETVALAVERAPLLVARDASRESATEELVRADALPDPTLTFGVQNLPIGGPDAYTLSNDRMTMQRIGVSQALPSRAKRTARREAAQARLVLAQAETASTELDVKRGAANAWIVLWAAQTEQKLLEDLRDQAGLAVRATRARLAGGSGSAGNALAARATDVELQNRLDDANARIDQARAGLERWLGEVQAVSAGSPPDFGRAPVDEAQLLADLDRQGPLLSWDAREGAADAALALAQAEKRPDWSVGAGVAKRGAGASNVVWLEVGVGLPLFSRNRQDRGISARAADLDAIRATRNDARRIQREAVRKAFARWNGLGAQVDRTRDTLLPLSRDRSRIALAAYSGGASLQEWLEARRDEIDARLDYANLLAAWGQAWVELAYLLPGPDTSFNRTAASSPEISR